LNYSKEEFRKELQDYLVRFPLMSNQPGQEPDGNPVLYASVAIVMYCRFFGSDLFVEQWCKELYENCRISPGVINRGSHKAQDTQEHDDYIGLLTASRFSGYTLPAKEIYLHGKENFWVYDEGKYRSKILGNLENFYTRFPGFTDHAAICAGHPSSMFWINFSFPFWKTGGSSLQKAWLRREAYLKFGERNRVTDYAISLWESGLQRHRPGLMGDVFTEYYGPNHVFSRWFKDKL